MRAGEHLPAEAGFALVWVLLAVAVMGVGLAALGTVWSADAQRQREDELLQVGQMYARAIRSYHQASPGTQKRFPPSVDALLWDTRFAVPIRHLRKPYPDPLSPERPWGELRAPDGGLRGIYSQGSEAPLRQQPLQLGELTLPVAAHYSQWQFAPAIAP